MSEWAPKVFWTTVSVVRADAGAASFAVALDGRPVRTPGKAALALPTAAVAELVAGEWRAQVGRINPTVMPYTRTANTAIDKVSLKLGEVVDNLAEYGGTDLLCYRAAGPQTLVARQLAGWDPLLDWAEQTLGARLVATVGVMPVEQAAGGLAALRARVAAMDAFRLAAFHDLVALSGSLVLGFAVAQARLTPAQAWDLASLDEQFQLETWGMDEDAAQKAAHRCAAFGDAARFFAAL